MKLFNSIILCLCLALSSSVTTAQIYKYQDANGKWHFTDSPPRDQEATAVETRQRTVSPDKDLRQQLLERFQPDDPIDEATLAVVTVLTKAGSGSGFFVTDDGYIVTNRHVVRPATSSQWKQREKQLSERRAQIEDFQLKVKEDTARLEDMRTYIEEQRGYFESGQSSRNDKERFRRYVERYETYQGRHKRNQQRLRDMEQDFGRADSEFGFASSMSNFSRNFTVTLKDGRELGARLVKVSKQHDLALLKIDNHATPHLPLSKRAYHAQGTQVFAIGSPLGISDALTTGIVTKPAKDFLLTDTRILPGNSGGPLVDASGTVIGVNTAVLTGGLKEGLGLAIYAEHIKSEFSRELQGRY